MSKNDKQNKKHKSAQKHDAVIADSAAYNADALDVLEGVAAVKQNPGRYIGDLNQTGLHHMLEEILDNSIDEYICGFCKYIYVKVTDRDVVVEDNGRGIPCGTNKEFGMSGLKLILTKENSGGKFGNANYRYSSGLHGVGAFVVNALSCKFEAYVYRNKNVFRLAFDRSIPVGGAHNDTEIVDVKPERIFFLKNTIKSEFRSGTRIVFSPDKLYFPADLIYEKQKIADRLNDLCALYPNLNIFFQFKDEQATQIKNRTPADLLPIKSKANLVFKQNLDFEVEIQNCKFHFVFNMIFDDYQEHYNSFVNTVKTVDHGSHVNIFRTAWLKLCKRLFANSKQTKLKKFNIEDCRIGSAIMVSCFVKKPIFSGQIKNKLTNRFDSKFAEVVFNVLLRFFIQNKDFLKSLKAKLLQNIKYREALVKVISNSKKEKQQNFFLPSKLVDCYASDEQTELFIVEGKSAGGSAVIGRQQSTQAVLPIQGKPINVFKNDIKKVLSNKEVASLFGALGMNYHMRFSVEKLRYDKIIILSDADFDGQHICVLQLALFFKLMPGVVLNNHLYISLPPLFSLNKKKSKQPPVAFCYDKFDLENKIQQFRGKFDHVQYYKGLGEMDASDLAVSAMNPETRKLFPVAITDANAFEKDFKLLQTLLADADESLHFRKQIVCQNFLFKYTVVKK